MNWKVEYILLIIFSTLVDYFCGLKLSKAESPSAKKKYLYSSLAINLLILFLFKYFNFFSQSAAGFLSLFHLNHPWATLKVLLPVGISFYTFQSMSYTIDIYYGKLKPEKNLGFFALYISFFPQLVAGPIERASQLLPQLTKNMYFKFENFTSGLKFILWGLLKKVVIADRLAYLVNAIYNHPSQHGSILLFITTFLFSFQIYCDFSGYSDIAIGTAKIFGIQLNQNFNTPYFSKSIPEFWKRWHISLSSWFRDYVYIPLGGNHSLKWRWYYNVAVVFLLSGLWHGANWTFIVWGGLHSLYYFGSKIWHPWKIRFFSIFKLNHATRIGHLLEISLTFSLVSFAWIFFRANTLTDAISIIAKVANPFQYHLVDLRYFSLTGNIQTLTVAFLSITLLVIIESIHNKKQGYSLLLEFPQGVRWGLYIFGIVVLVFLGKFNTNEFIYFQF